MVERKSKKQQKQDRENDIPMVGEQAANHLRSESRNPKRSITRKAKKATEEKKKK